VSEEEESHGEDRRNDVDSRARINELGRNYNRFARLVLILFYIQVASLFTFGILDTYLAIENHNRAAENADILVRIQVERRNNIVQNCEAQNSRHDTSIKTLNDIINGLVKKNPSQEKAIRQSAHYNILLINALAPVQDCLKLVQRQIQTPPQAKQ
jgi:hypothetical protein